MTFDLFESTLSGVTEPLGPRACILRGFALPFIDRVLPELEQVRAAAPFRHLVTPSGHTMSVAMTNCGRLGWVSDEHGYRYSARDPLSGQPWPALPAAMLALARAAAAACDFPDYEPDACLVNQYLPGSRLTLHQDRNERDLEAPIVSVSLGLPATFQFGGLKRSDPVTRVGLWHGDVAVWGGVDRMRFHGINTLKDGHHVLLGRQRLNFTFRVVLDRARRIQAQEAE